MTLALHRSLAAGRWQELTLAEQLANIGSEFGRAARARDSGNDPRFEAAFDRCLELVDLTLADDRWVGRRREITRLRELVVDVLTSENDYGVTVRGINDYFLAFAIRVRR